MANFEIAQIENRPEAILIVLGEKAQGGEEAVEFSSALNELVEKGVEFVILDLGKVKVMNSSGLGMIVGGLNSLKKNKANMALINVPDKIMELLKTTRLDKVLKTFNDKEQALKSFSNT